MDQLRWSFRSGWVSRIESWVVFPGQLRSEWAQVYSADWPAG